MKNEIVKFKNVAIECPKENGDIYVAPKPICDALELHSPTQIEKLKNGLNGVSINPIITRSVSSNWDYRCDVSFF
jgi:hypothetical protein